MVLAVASGLAAATPYYADTLVTNGSTRTPFAQNKQNEPAVAVNPSVPTIAAAGVNDEIDLEACNNRSDARRARSRQASASPASTSPTTAARTGCSRRTPAGRRATASGSSERSRRPADNCDPHVGPIGTLPRYYENGLVADGDPAVGFGPRRGANGKFSWTNGWRLYYANIASNFSAERSEATFKGFEAIAVSRLDSENYAGGEGRRQQRVEGARDRLASRTARSSPTTR